MLINGINLYICGLGELESKCDN